MAQMLKFDKEVFQLTDQQFKMHLRRSDLPSLEEDRPQRFEAGKHFAFRTGSDSKDFRLRNFEGES